MEEGSWGALRSTIPHYTLPAWPSMVTGLHPGKLGIFGFRRRLPGTYRFGVSMLGGSAVPAVWDILGQEGRRCVIVGIPGTFPPREVAGVSVSGFPAPANDGRLVFTHPERLSRELDVRFGLYELEVYESYEPGKEQVFVDACKRVAEMHWGAARWLAENQAWDLLAFVSLTIDRASHYFWRFMDAQHADHNPDEAAQWGTALRDLYRLEDSYLGDLLGMMNRDDLVLITSDHGFCARNRTFFVNDWLRQKGYLRLRSAPGSRSSLGHLMKPVVNLYQRNPKVRSLMARFRSTALRDRFMSAFRLSQRGRAGLEDAPIDWANTIAYASDQHRVYLNVKGRDPQGRVAPAAYEEQIARLESELTGLTDENGHSLLAEVLRGRDIYHGPFAEEGPDLVVFLDDHRCAFNSSVGGDQVLQPSTRLSGAHHPEGLLMIQGPGVERGKRIRADIVDIAPTMLHALGAPISAASDGKPIAKAFAPNSEFLRRSVRQETLGGVEREGHVWTDEEESQLLERLEGLGYV
jgi:predicted AlkP superfamily phosphohydrolase/phosphomutase